MKEEILEEVNKRMDAPNLVEFRVIRNNFSQAESVLRKKLLSPSVDVLLSMYGLTHFSTGAEITSLREVWVMQNESKRREKKQAKKEQKREEIRKEEERLALRNSPEQIRRREESLRQEKEQKALREKENQEISDSKKMLEDELCRGNPCVLSGSIQIEMTLNDSDKLHMEVDTHGNPLHVGDSRGIPNAPLVQIMFGYIPEFPSGGASQYDTSGSFSTTGIMKPYGMSILAGTFQKILPWRSALLCRIGSDLVLDSNECKTLLILNYFVDGHNTIPLSITPKNASITLQLVTV